MRERERMERERGRYGEKKRWREKEVEEREGSP